MLNPGDDAPLFATKSIIDGTPFSLEDGRGKVTLLVFSAPDWCSPCQMELDLLVEIHRRFGQSPTNAPFRIAMVSHHRDLDKLKSLLTAARVEFPVLENGFTASGTSIAAAYGVSAIPHHVVIRGDLKVCKIPYKLGSIDDFEELLEGCGLALNKLPFVRPLQGKDWPDDLLRMLLKGPPNPLGEGRGVPREIWPELAKRDVLIGLAMNELGSAVVDEVTRDSIQKDALKLIQGGINRLSVQNLRIRDAPVPLDH